MVGADADTDADGGRRRTTSRCCRSASSELYADLGSPEKVLVDLGCASHNAMWEQNHMLLFRASLEWLQQGSVNGTKTGTLQLGY